MYNGGKTFDASNPEALAAKLHYSGFGKVALQWDDPKNRPLAVRLRDACQGYGISFGVWEAFPTPGSGHAAVNASGAEFYIAQAEENQPWQEIVDNFRHYHPDMPAAVVTTFVGIGAPEYAGDDYHPEVAKPVIDAGFHCLTEAYLPVSSNWTPDRLDWTARVKLGFPRTTPTIGLWAGPRGRYMVSDYYTYFNLGHYPGPWVWLAETMLQQDWDTFRGLYRR